MNKTQTFLRVAALFLCILAGTSISMANYLRVTNIVQDQVNGTVSFDLAWDNSWRIDSMGAPNHWDAAWVFVKWRECSAPITTDWTHGVVSTTVGDHTFGDLEPTLSSGTAIGIDAAPNNLGVMLRRDQNGIFPNAAATTVTLRMTNLPATGDYDVRVFGVEMVYVPQGAFIAGGNQETYPLNIGGNPFTVTNENAISVNYLWSNVANLPATFPKGYDPFYCMKYEISQAQYAAFLNTLTQTGQNNHFPNQFNNNRHRIRNGGTPPDIYFSDRPDRAANYLSWANLCAYLDWACLRPMSDLEYEKACRGNGPYLGGYAWGSSDITEATALTSPEDGTETTMTPNANAHFVNNIINGGDGGYGPYRVGIFATNATTSRLETGATYYGIMEMSGNVWEQCVAVHTDANILPFTRNWGNGNLNATGFSDVATWPYQDVIAGNTTYRVIRGGGYASAAGNLRVSDRQYYYYGRSNGETTVGGRGVR
ncbi:MAG: SUMF1/EgtB/PvdO family nonheme iron enzyme [Bacteroidota bacterium]